MAAQLAQDKKATDVVVLQMKELTPITDYFVICSGQSTVHVKTIAEHIEEGLRRHKVKPFGLEGLPLAQWVLLDYIDVVVHVFEEARRQYYQLEKLWLDAPRVQTGQQ